MFSETEGSRKTIGDVDVLFHDGLYHLFHLVLPNHDFIAHAVSTNGINWRRINNALFIGDPGSWDDLMLWTMHVSPDPHQVGRWRMFYTGLSRREQGRLQRIGMATSHDLFHWKKSPVNWHDSRGAHDPDRITQAREQSRRRHANELHAELDQSSCFPLEPDSRHYEASIDEGRKWISFRDPFYYWDGDAGWMLVAGRENEGPIIRRGCVSLLREIAPNQFESQPPLHAPQLYDDIEVPNLINLEGEYYLIGSIREDAKIRYWHTDDLGKPWRSYHDNVLMAKGNYAGRVSRDETGWLLWNFFVLDGDDRTSSNVMPIPKRLMRTEAGMLRTRTFEHLEEWTDELVPISQVRRLKRCSSTEPISSSVENNQIELRNDCGFQVFVFDGQLDSFQFEARLRMRGRGKCGLVFRVDPETHDGYYLSLDMLKGIAQLRSWRTDKQKIYDDMMSFETLQSADWYSETPEVADVKLIAFGSYLEFSIGGYILLSLVNQTFDRGLVGVYLESARLSVSEIKLRKLHSPDQGDDHLVVG